MRDRNNLSESPLITVSPALLPISAAGRPDWTCEALLPETDSRDSSVRTRVVAPVRTAVAAAQMDLWEDETPARAETAVPDVVVLSEEVFRDALIRERKRADRFDELFALVTVVLSEEGSEAAPWLAAEVAAALHDATRATDLVGWMKQDVVLGVTLAEVTKPGDKAVRQMQARVQQQLGRRLEPSALEKLEVKWYFHAGVEVGGEGLAETDPLLDDLLAAQRRRTLLDACKRAIDLAGSLILLTLLSPLLLLIAVLVKLTSAGPVLFRQERIGHFARPFTMLKFRTMTANVGHGLHQQFVTDFIKSSSEQRPGNGKTFFKIVNDPRVTPVGRILRRTSLDELPQLWNVLRGDMSLVGPRPPLRYELEQYRSWHWRRVLEGKPGITGLWQVTGRSRTTFDEMVRLDIRYVRTRSVWTDLKILLATPRAVVTGKGAC